MRSTLIDDSGVLGLRPSVDRKRVVQLVPPAPTNDCLHRVMRSARVAARTMGGGITLFRQAFHLAPHHRRVGPQSRTDPPGTTPTPFAGSHFGRTPGVPAK